jgi:flagellar basal-body rod modification protein FlgD
MDTSATTGTTSAATARSGGANPASSEGKGKGASALSSDFETFLKMLTVQLNNQDPLNPIQSTDFAVQLATFSGVEQQVRSNELLESLLGQQSVSALSQLADWVGMEARAAVPAAFDGAKPVDYYTDPPATADQATLIVRDAAGKEVSRSAISDDMTTGTWNGTDARGAPLPAGDYSLFVEYRAAGEVIATETAEVYATVSEARIADGRPVIVFASGDEVPADDVSAVRAPQG